MINPVWLDAKALAIELGVSIQRAREIARNASIGTPYKGVHLVTRPVTGYRGKLQYEVLKSSIYAISVPAETAPPPRFESVAVVDPSRGRAAPAHYDLGLVSQPIGIDWVDFSFSTVPHTPFNGGLVVNCNADGTLYVVHERDDDHALLPLCNAVSTSFDSRAGGVVGIESKSVDYVTQKFVALTGSFDTTVRLRSDGSTIEASGNFGRFNRPDNLFCYAIQQIIDIFNTKILPLLGLPEGVRAEPGSPYLVSQSRLILISDYDDLPEFRRAFLAHEGNLKKSANVFETNKQVVTAFLYHLSKFDEEKYSIPRTINVSKPLDFKEIWHVSDREYDRILKIYYEYRFDKKIYGYFYTWKDENWTGVKFSRIDLCMNYAAGSYESALDLVHLYSFRSLERLTPRYLPGSIYWASRKEGKVHGYEKPKVYVKCDEMLAHAKKGQLIEIDGIKEFKDEYLKNLYNYVKQQGCLRFEISFFGKKLDRYGLNYLGDLIEQGGYDMLIKHYEARFKPLLADNEETAQSQFDLSTLDPRLRGLALDYFAGRDFRKEVKQGVLPPRTFYRNRTELLAFGIDIGNTLAGALDVIPAPTRLMVLRPLTPLVVPDFYHMPRTGTGG